MTTHIPHLKDIPADTISHILTQAHDVKRNPNVYRTALQSKTMALLFQKTSTRTRVSFEIGMYELGGYATYLDWRTTNFTLADVEDEIKVLSRYVDVIVARVYGHDDILTMTKYSEVPIINGLCNRYHPCQALTDMMTLQENIGDLAGKTLAYIGDGNNVCNSLIIAATKTNLTLHIATPEGYEPAKDALDFAKQHHGTIKLFRDPAEAMHNVDAVYTDTWVSIGQEAETTQRHKIFRPYQLNQNLYEQSCPNALILHDLPAHRGYEITADMINHPNSVIIDQSENRKHAQKSLLLWLLNQKN